MIVCGGRDYGDRARVFDVLDKFLARNEHVRIIHGAARGADLLADTWARWRNEVHGTEATAMPADWKAHGRAAGPKRNELMLAELLFRQKGGHKIGVVAFPGGKGTAHMRRIAEDAGVWVLVVQPSPSPSPASTPTSSSPPR